MVVRAVAEMLAVVGNGGGSDMYQLKSNVDGSGCNDDGHMALSEIVRRWC